MSIQVLSSEIVNQIAAGEVVERPSHLVKELLENSLDAGATLIHIEVSEGGRSIRVLDNGSGIFSSELDKALQRHATSKIRKTDDLWNLHTFGFRGEALASAAAVSHLILRSQEETEKKASQIESLFGELSSIKPSSQTVGTEVRIEKLFENVPARLKFLKSESSEITQIKQVVKALALAHPSVEFKLTANSELQLYYHAQSDFLKRAQDVLEKKELYITRQSSGHFECEVVFSSPHEVARTAKQIWIFVQNRWVQDRALQAAVMDSYRSLLMHGEYPCVVVKLRCQPDEIDVNIHPTKSQVKFQDSSTAFRAVHSTLRQALEKAPWIQIKSSEPMNYNEGPRISTSSSSNMSFTDRAFEQTLFKNKEYAVSTHDIAELKVENIVKDFNFSHAQENTGGYWSSLQVIGQANLTYIVTQKNDRLVFVDQHAAHERVVFESLMQAWREKKFEVQSYLFPLAIDLSEEKIEVLLKNQKQIEELGFELEQLGPVSIGIKSAPSLIKDSSLPLVFEKMAHDLSQNGGSYAIEKKISDLFATMACHSVIRAGQSLSLAEMQELLRSMDRFALSSFCPHGRPVSVDRTFTELEKLFGRIN